MRRKKERRHGPRNSVTWEGRYGRLGQPEWEWQPCTVDNVSSGGAQLTTLLPCALRTGDRIGVAVERLGSTPVGITLCGKVAHLTRVTDGDAQDDCAIGVAIDFTTPQEQRIAESLFSIG
jgi:hypothetical protein